MTLKIDNKDRMILEVLKEDAKLTNREIAKKVKLPITTVFNRVRRLEAEGVIQGYTVKVNHKKLGLNLIGYTFVHYDISVWGKETSKAELKRQLLSLPQVEEIKYIIGQYDILLKFRMKDIGDLNNVLLEHLRKIPGFGQTQTFFVLEDVL